MFKYSISLSWSDEDEGYIAVIPELPGLSAFGETPEEAAKEVINASEGYIEVLKEDGCELPEPERIKTFSGQTRLRLPKSLHASLSAEAEKEGVSLNTYIVSLLSERNISKRLYREVVDQLKESALSQAFSVQPEQQSATSEAEIVFFNENHWDIPETRKDH